MLCTSVALGARRRCHLAVTDDNSLLLAKLVASCRVSTATSASDRRCCTSTEHRSSSKTFDPEMMSALRGSDTSSSAGVSWGRAPHVGNIGQQTNDARPTSFSQDQSSLRQIYALYWRSTGGRTQMPLGCHRRQLVTSLARSPTS
jgi:hypothetical protein